MSARLRCPECGADSTVAKAFVDAQNVCRRERICEGGRHRFHTSEVIDGTPIDWQPEGDPAA